MKITFFSNFLNHHQLPLAQEMFRLLGKDYRFVATEPVAKERLSLGYHDMNEMHPFCLNSYASQKNYKIALSLGYESDVAIIGSASNIFIGKRLEENKLTFYWWERIFKRGYRQALNFKVLGSLLKRHTAYRKKNLYMLCASAYTAADFRLLRAYIGKTYKWGYFPEVREYNLESLMIKKEQNKVPKLLWVGRFFELKHLDHAIKTAYMLKNNGYMFELDIIGAGPKESDIKHLIDCYRLGNEVKLLGSMKPEIVREHMESANIHLFTSNFQEGWGAVLNESMNSGCAVVASHAIGAVPYLIKNKKNGLIYKNGDVNHLFICVKRLLDEKPLCRQIGIEAYNTMVGTWNAKVAAERFLKLAEALLKGEQIEFHDGPCSLAGIVSSRYHYWE